MSVKWQDYVERARSKGVLAKELFVVWSKPVADADEIAAALPDHLAYQKGLEAKGILFAAGPMADESGEVWSLEGLIVLRAKSLDDARATAEADPMHASGLKAFVVRPWLLNEGCLEFKVSLSNRSVAFG